MLVKDGGEDDCVGRDGGEDDGEVPYFFKVVKRVKKVKVKVKGEKEISHSW